MSQGPRTRVRLDGKVYRVVRSSKGVQVYERREKPGWFSLIYASRKERTASPLIARILAAETEGRINA